MRDIFFDVSRFVGDAKNPVIDVLFILFFFGVVVKDVILGNNDDGLLTIFLRSCTYIFSELFYRESIIFICDIFSDKVDFLFSKMVREDFPVEFYL